MQSLLKSSATFSALLIVVLGGGILIGIATPPDAWFANLVKPSFNPPGWVFGPVWFVLYVLISIAGWRQCRYARNGIAFKIWVVQMLLNFLWSPLFFGAHRIDLSLIVILALLASILLFIRQTWRPDRLSAALFLPYAVWVAFASLLNGSILFLNL